MRLVKIFLKLLVPIVLAGIAVFAFFTLVFDGNNLFDRPYILFPLILFIALPFGIYWSFKRDFNDLTRTQSRILFLYIFIEMFTLFIGLGFILPILLSAITQLTQSLLPANLVMPLGLAWIILSILIGAWISNKSLPLLKSKASRTGKLK